MKKLVKKSKKKVTLEILAEKIGEVASSVEDLAIMTAKGFESVDKRFDGMENRIENLELGQKKIFQEIINIHDTFVKRSEFENVVQRLARLEEKVKIKIK